MINSCRDSLKAYAALRFTCPKETKGGYGICMSKQAAEDVSHYDWFKCKMASKDSYVSACLSASLHGDKPGCKSIVDSAGQPCAWCSFVSLDVCLTAEQAAYAGRFGAKCDAGRVDSTKASFDTTCLMESMHGDKSSCQSMVDSDGKNCEWCMLKSWGLCLTSDQADMAGEYGADCNPEMHASDTEILSDPYDTACLAASIQGDESICKSTIASDGQPCEWCMLSSFGLCLTADQAEMIEQFGAECSKDVVSLSSSLQSRQIAA